MIHINLLPFRAARKKENVRRQVTIALLTVIFVVTAMAYYHVGLNNTIDEWTAKNANIKLELLKFEQKAKKVDKIKNALKNLRKKIEIIKNLETKRKLAVSLLDQMTQMVVANVPNAESESNDTKPVKRLWFTRLQSNSKTITINGIALDNKTVADFMTRLETSKFFENVNLTTLQQKRINKLDLKNFVITCNTVIQGKKGTSVPKKAKK